MLVISLLILHHLQAQTERTSSSVIHGVYCTRSSSTPSSFCISTYFMSSCREVLGQKNNVYLHLLLSSSIVWPASFSFFLLLRHYSRSHTYTSSPSRYTFYHLLLFCILIHSPVSSERP